VLRSKIAGSLIGRLILLGIVLLSLTNPLDAGATHVDPQQVDGNHTCSDLGANWTELKVEPVTSGTYSDGTLTVNLTVTAPTISWTSNLGVDAVFVKGGPDGNLYLYDPEATSDTGLHAPINPNTGQPFGLSHVSFCYDVEVEVSKTASTSLTRTWQWTIDKSVTPDNWDLFNGDSGTSDYTVTVTKTGSVDSNWAVSGTISVHNPSSTTSATITGVTDTITGSINATVSCGVTFPHVLTAGNTLNCTYSSALPDGTNRTNTATATTSGAIGGGSGSAAVDFSTATLTEINPSVNVSDTNGGSWAFSNSGSVSYTRTFSCNGDEGTHNNTATIVETGQSDSASVTVNCYQLSVTKTASTSNDKRWNWTIDKTGDQTNLILSPGQQFSVNYQVVVNATSTEINYAVSGGITISNPNPSLAATLNSVVDVVSPAIPANVICPSLSVPASGALNCTYSASLPDGSNRTNTATATQQNYSYDKDKVATPSGTTNYSGSANVDFTNATVTETDECIDVTDTYAGFLGTVCAGDAPETFNYSRTIGPYNSPDGCGDHTIGNTASFVTNDTGTSGADSWTVLVHVPCDFGCTLTQGYWKTHSEFGPAPYDDTWAQLTSGASTSFFLSGQTWYQVFWTPVSGNAYYQLAHQYMAAKLNILNGASVPASVQTAFDQATSLFSTHTPAQIGALRGNNPLRAQFISLAGTLASYNEGALGPGHCSEQ
jgi:hypothetical protein